VLQRFFIAVCVASLAMAPASAQSPDPSPPEVEDQRPPSLEGELTGYLALPVLLVLVVIVGVLVGGGEEVAESP
jgi:hypothetical protein